MSKLGTALLRIHDRLVYGTPEQQQADDERMAFNRAVHCPNCGDDNSDLISTALVGAAGGTRKMCAVTVEQDGSVCGCLHQYHAIS